MRLGIALTLVLIAGLAIWSSTERTEGEPSTAVSRPQSAPEVVADKTLDPGLSDRAGRRGADVGEVAISSELEVEPARKRVLVDAVFEDGAPIPHLPLYAFNIAPRDSDHAPEPLSWRAFTDADGRASFEVSPGCALEFTTNLDEDEATPTRVEASAPDETRIVVRRPRPALVVFHGRIANMRGQPVAGARAVAVCEITSNDVEVAQPSDVGIVANCDASGLFRLELEPWRLAFVRVEAPGLSQRTLELTRGHERPDRALEIHLPAAGSLTLRANGPTGSPVAGAVLRLTCDAAGDTASGRGETAFWPVYPQLVWSSTLDADGRATITNLPMWRGFSLTLTEGGRVLRRSPEEGWLEAGESRELVWSLGIGAKVTGQLVDEHGRGIANHEMWLFADPHDGRTDVFGPDERDEASMNSTTAEDGSFVFEDVTAGKWKVAPRPCIPEKGAPFFYPRLVPIELEALVAQAHVVVQVGIQTFASGVVLDPDGSPVEGAEVEARNLAFTPVITDVSGRFRIGPLPPVECELSARVRDGPHASSGWIAVSVPSNSVDLRLTRGAVLAGRVMGVADQVAYVRLGGLDGQDSPSRIEVRDGVYRFSGLAEGRYMLRAWTLDDGYLIVPRIVEMGAGETRTDYEVRLEASGLIRFLGHALTESRSVSVEIDRNSWKSEFVTVGGTAEIRVPPGDALLRVHDVDGAEIGARVLQIEPGSTIDVDVRGLGG